MSDNQRAATGEEVLRLVLGMLEARRRAALFSVRRDEARLGTKVAHELRADEAWVASDARARCLASVLRELRSMLSERVLGTGMLGPTRPDGVALRPEELVDALALSRLRVRARGHAPPLTWSENALLASVLEAYVGEPGDDSGEALRCAVIEQVQARLLEYAGQAEARRKMDASLRPSEGGGASGEHRAVRDTLRAVAEELDWMMKGRDDSADDDEDQGSGG